MNTNIDLFNHYEDLPLKIKEIIFSFNTIELSTYKDCKELTSSLKLMGYTCQYDLDGNPYNLQKLETTNETPEEMNTENNKLIAEFMQLGKQLNLYENPITGEYEEELKYHSDWNRLISVIEKCRESQIFGSQRLIDNIDRRFLKLDLLATYDNVVDFIQWHNQQKN